MQAVAAQPYAAPSNDDDDDDDDDAPSNVAIWADVLVLVLISVFTVVTLISYMPKYSVNDYWYYDL
eukprot:SAG31_NODE_515_length_14710_cov_6.289097_8_plen_66_part_00